MFFDHLLDLSSNATDRSNRCPLEFRRFQGTVEHSLNERRRSEGQRKDAYFDEGGFLEDFVRRADQLQFLHDLRGFVQIEHHTGGSDTEIRLERSCQSFSTVTSSSYLRRHLLHGDKARVLRGDRS